jgi:hypothetical protein
VLRSEHFRRPRLRQIQKVGFDDVDVGETTSKGARKTSPIGRVCRYERISQCRFDTMRWWLVFGDGVT